MNLRNTIEYRGDVRYARKKPNLDTEARNSLPTRNSSAQAEILRETSDLHLPVSRMLVAVAWLIDLKNIFETTFLKVEKLWSPLRQSFFVLGENQIGTRGGQTKLFSSARKRSLCGENYLKIV